MTARFYASHEDGTALLESSAFRHRGSEPPPNAGAARKAYDELVDALTAEGWQPEGPAHGVWYAVRFVRPAAGGAAVRDRQEPMLQEPVTPEPVPVTPGPVRMPPARPVSQPVSNPPSPAVAAVASEPAPVPPEPDPVFVPQPAPAPIVLAVAPAAIADPPPASRARRRTLRTGAVVLAVGLVTAGSAAGYRIIGHDGAAAADGRSAVRATHVSRPVATSQPTAAAAAVGLCAVRATHVSRPVATSQPTAAAAARTTADDAAPAEAAPAQAAPAAGGPRLRLAVSARSPSWLEIRRGAATGRILFSGELEPGRTLHFAGGRLWARFGSAGNLAIRVNGVPRTLQGTIEHVFAAARR